MEVPRAMASTDSGGEGFKPFFTPGRFAVRADEVQSDGSMGVKLLSLTSGGRVKSMWLCN